MFLTKQLFLYTLLLITSIPSICFSAAGSDEAHIPDLDRYTVEYIRKQEPNKRDGHDISLLPLQHLYTFPSKNYFELVNALRKNQLNYNPEVIFIANGVYDLDDVVSQINDNTIIKRINDKTYISYRPIYIAPTASLKINGVELRLSLSDAVFIAYNGDFYVIDTTITSWNEATDNYGINNNIRKEDLLMFGTQEARPYLLGMRGSTSYFANSIFQGLGYKGPSTFGITFSTSISEQNSDNYSLYGVLKKLKKPEGYIIGSIIQNCFFGFYSNRAGKVILVGNTFRNNIVYNVDPHDYTENLVVARNLVYGAKNAHGIIISREVNHSTIMENIVLANKASGIMLDRKCEHNKINNNIVIANQGDGISIFESDKNSIRDNKVFNNISNGVYIRNSDDIELKNNLIKENGKNGVEVSIVNIDQTETRDFVLDPYHKSSSASFLENNILKNINAAISAKNKPRLFINNNNFTNSGPLFFAGDIAEFTKQILIDNESKGFLYCPDKDPSCK